MRRERVFADLDIKKVKRYNLFDMGKVDSVGRLGGVTYEKNVSA